MRLTVSFLTLFVACIATEAAHDPELQLIVPTELEETLRTTSDAATNTKLGHYGPPPDGCEDDETAFHIKAIPGAVCSAKCTDFPTLSH
jgi:hypothetical protein